MINQGYTGAEIAELLELPPALEQQWHTHGYYGSVSHNVKAIYQRYMGWYDANPANLWPHPPEAVAPATSRRWGPRRGARRRAAGVGRGRLPVVRRGRQAPGVRRRPRRARPRSCGRRVRAARLRRRERHLAQRLPRRRHRAAHGQLRHAGLRLGATCSGALTVDAGPRQHRHPHRRAPRLGRAPPDRLAAITDEDTTYLVELRNGALNHRTVDGGARRASPRSRSRAARSSASSPARSTSPAALADGTVAVDGDPAVLGRLVALLAPVDPDFDIVTP